MPGTAGCIIDPPAASEYAVLPVGVAMIRPSPCTMVTCLSFTLGHQHSHSQDTDMIYNADFMCGLIRLLRYPEMLNTVAFNVL